jgi:hypothetical protein
LTVTYTTGGGSTPDPDPDPDPEESLLGTGSTSTSLVDYPKIENTTTGDWFVNGSVASSGDGTTLGTAFKTLQEGLSALGDGETLLVKSGTYVFNSTINRNTSWSSQTRIMAYGDDRPVLDFSNISSRCVYFGGSSKNELWHRFHVRNNNRSRGEVHTGHEGWYAYTGASDLVWSDLWASDLGGEGFRFYRVDDSQVLDCATWDLGDSSLSPSWTSPPDGFICSGSGSSGGESNRNVFARCVAINAPDDGFDCFSGIDTLYVDCVSIQAGKYYDGTGGRGRNGFKMGGGTGADNTAKGCFSYDCGRGFEDNGGTRVTFLSGTATACDWVGVNGPTGTTVVRDMISLANDAPNSNIGGTASNNTWNLGITNAGWESPGTPDWDYSLSDTSGCLGVGVSGGNLGASTVALALAKEWLQKDLHVS